MLEIIRLGIIEVTLITVRACIQIGTTKGRAGREQGGNRTEQQGDLPR